MFLSIDLGSTSFKASIYDRELNLLGGGSAYLDYAQLNERVELSLDTVSDAVEEALRSADPGDRDGGCTDQSGAKL